MPASQGHTGRFEQYSKESEPFFSVNWIHHFGNEQDLAFAEEEAEEIRRECIKKAESVEALRQMCQGDSGAFVAFIFGVIEDTACLGRLLEFEEADELERNPNQIVIDYDAGPDSDPDAGGGEDGD